MIGRFRRRRVLMRLHLADNLPSIEGVFVGFEAGHYKLANARHFEAADQSIPLDGIAWVPRARVLYAQELG